MRVRAILLLATLVLVGILLSGVALALPHGTSASDTLNGNKKPNTFHGGDGNDSIYGQESGDDLYGENGNDDLHGGKGDDYLNGGPDNDSAFGDKGHDRFDFNENHPHLSRQAGPAAPLDQLNGGPGDDTFVTVDDNPDIINCGTGNDRAWIDAESDTALTPQEGGTASE